jgi:integrase
MSRTTVRAAIDPNGRLLETWMSEDGIQISPPSENDIARGKPYHRITFYDSDDIRRHASGGLTFQTAIDALPVIRERMKKILPRNLKPVSNLIETFLEESGLSHRKWSPSTKAGYEQLLKKYALPHIGSIACGALTAKQIKTVVQSGPTVGQQRRLRVAMSGLLKYGWAEEWVKLEPLHLLKTATIRVDEADRKAKIAAPSLTTELRPITEADVPTHEEVANFASELGQLRGAPWWYELFAMVPAYTGLRLGEVLGLEAGDFDLEKRYLLVSRQVAEVKGKPVETGPKRASSRITLIPELTPPSAKYPKGYPLLEMLSARLAEMSGPTSPLFPAPRGRFWRRSNFSRRVYIPAAKAAGWRLDDDGNVALKYHGLRHRFCTWLLWDLGNSPQDVAEVAGHKDVSITLKIYSGNDGGALQRIAAINAATK